MKISYDLSSRQRKELIERGRNLRIALPLPEQWQDRDDPLAYARSVLRGIDRAWVRSADIIELPVVAPLGHAGGGPPSSLAGLWGSIAGDGECETKFVFLVIAIEARISSSDSPRREGHVQWPAAIVVDGVRFPPLAT